MMASNGQASDQAIARVVAAYDQTTQSSISAASKREALQYLTEFQKSSEAWTILFQMLSTDTISGPVQMFAATSLKGKMVIDLQQLPRDSLPALRQSLFDLLLKYQDGPKPVRTALSVGLAHLAIQFTEWKDVLPLVITQFSGKGDGATACFLEFLKVLAEELTEGRKINLSEDELSERTSELLEQNAPQVLQILSSYASSSPNASKDSIFIACVQSWTRDIPLNDILTSPVMNTVVHALGFEEAFDAAIECLIALIRETKDVDDSLDTIQSLTQLIFPLRQKLAVAADEEDSEVFKGIARLFAEIGESWVVLIARDPTTFKPVVETILEITTRDWDKEAIGYTFRFWEDIKLWLVLDKFSEAKQLYYPIFSQLVDNMVKHLQFPVPENGDETDLFEGDRDAEERFRNYRHEMGNVLKDCCDVLEATECLKKPYQLVQKWVATYGSQVTPNHIPHWQELEAPIFAIRALGSSVPPEENVMMPQLIPILVQIPDHEKIRYQAVMTLGRYTEWTANHPETLELQLKFIMDAFDHPSKEVVRGACLSFQFFCTDCASLLKDFFGNIHQFYVAKLDTLNDGAQIDVTEGMAAILAKQPTEKLYENMKLCCDPIVQSLVRMASAASDDAAKEKVADKIQLLTIFVQQVHPWVPPGQDHPAVAYCQEVLPVLSEIAARLQDSVPVLERVCRCWRHMVLSYRTGVTPMLASLAEKLVEGFKATRQGCFLWATDSIVREFHEGSEDVDPAIPHSIIPFYEQQANVFLTALQEVSGDQLPDLIEDFFRLTTDVVIYHTVGIFNSPILGHVITAATHALTLLKTEVLIATLNFLRDFIAYGSDNPPSSSLDGSPRTTPEIQATVKSLLGQHGKALTQRVLVGMLYSFPEDCIPAASGVMLDLLKVIPQESGSWLGQTLNEVPSGAVRPQERDRLMNQIQQKLSQKDETKIRGLLQDFTNSYRRRNVAPREGLGILEPTKFVYKR